MSPTTPAAKPSRRQELLDDLIQGTNSSSIVSKRSVEHIYYRNEPSYFRYFVKKPLRRAPLINRGYWLRLKAIDVTVRQFLTRTSPHRKVVVNLGCGSDVIPWQCHVREPEASRNALFVDVDYPDLMRKKRTIVQETPQLRQLLGQDVSFSQSDDDPILTRSSTYCQVACDLRELQTLRNALASLAPLEDAEVLFVAEVSVTYMDTASADALIEWASGVGKAEFCLLEQILPEGPLHPFAQTMLAHFNKLKTQLKSVHQYQTLASQRARFESRGWAHVQIQDLWEAWTGGDFVSSTERTELDEVEPFDEWEEFILFARHYCLLHARSAPPNSASTIDQDPATPVDRLPAADYKVRLQSIGSRARRRFGHAITISSPEGWPHMSQLFGLGADGREETYCDYSLKSVTSQLQLPLQAPPPRMCSTMTDLGDYGFLLAGGRGSPSKPSAESWLLKKTSSGIVWEKTPDLPLPLYRHSTIRLGDSSLALVMGGKTGASHVSDGCFLFHPEKGWLVCEATGNSPEPTFGGILCNSPRTQVEHGSFSGLWCGGLRKDGTLSTKVYTWDLKLEISTDTCYPSIHFEEIHPEDHVREQLSVFGADMIEVGSYAAICGGAGVGAHHQGQTMTFISARRGECHVEAIIRAPSDEEDPLFMIGSSAFLNGSEINIIGGGATCFSMGTHWERGIFHVPLPDHILATLDDRARVREQSDYEFLEAYPTRPTQLSTAPQQGPASISQIPRGSATTSDEFEEMVRCGRPAVLEGMELGGCVGKWTPEYLTERVGPDRKVVVHECPNGSRMDFNTKNFKYATYTFRDAVSSAKAGSGIYMRSLAHETPSQTPANLAQDFPLISEDFQLPEQLDLVKKNTFSSVLRLSGRVNMWLHYDVMANVYVQVHGSRRMILFPPSDVSHLLLTPGSSSSSLDVFSNLSSPTLASTHPHEVTLNPGDVLFIPPMWLHTAKPISDMSVAVNVFFRDLEAGYAAGRDVYGNKDLEAYDKGRQDVAKIARGFEKLPLETRRFYLSRMADELRGLAE